MTDEHKKRLKIIIAHLKIIIFLLLEKRMQLAIAGKQSIMISTNL